MQPPPAGGDDGPLPCERALCSLKGDCKRYGANVLVAGDKAASAMVRWLRESKGATGGASEGAEADVLSSLDILSVWGVSAATDHGAAGAPSSHARPLGVAMLAHALLLPYRVIVAVLEPVGALVDRQYRFGESLDPSRAGLFDFLTSYGFLHSLQIDWASSWEVHLHRYDWEVAGWDSVRLLGRAESSAIWTRRRPTLASASVDGSSKLRACFEEGLDLLDALQNNVARAPTPAVKAQPKPHRRRVGRTQRGQDKLVRSRRKRDALPPPAPPAPVAPSLLPRALPSPVAASAGGHACPRPPIPAGPMSAILDEEDLAAGLDDEVGVASSASAICVAAPAAIKLPDRPYCAKGTDVAYLRCIIGEDRYDFLRATGYAIKYDRRASVDGACGSYSGDLYHEMLEGGVRRGGRQVTSRIYLRDPDDHPRCVRLIYAEIAEIHNADTHADAALEAIPEPPVAAVVEAGAGAPAVDEVFDADDLALADLAVSSDSASMSYVDLSDLDAI